MSDDEIEEGQRRTNKAFVDVLFNLGGYTRGHVSTACIKMIAAMFILKALASSERRGRAPASRGDSFPPRPTISMTVPNKGGAVVQAGRLPLQQSATKAAQQFPLARLGPFYEGGVEIDPV